MPSTTSPASFRSAIDVWFIAASAVFVVLTGTAVARMLMRGPTPSIIVPLLAIGFWAWLVWGTSYVVTDTELLVRCGPVRRAIPLHAIEAIRPTGSVWSAPALSLDRIEVTVRNAAPIVISPAERASFLSAVKEHAPNVALNGFSGQ